ncbi:uncharacterized protein LOC121412293 [Lytechinus variegatus]|uniref:uncharacterized protein LOC121412293 n=1 Tax=Lytechinus variegatus TaxID=7654 RepID=UPI001BB1EB11|nr:uncharacterized protein LOC121412293 [Lytechinus variegatus]
MEEEFSSHENVVDLLHKKLPSKTSNGDFEKQPLLVSDKDPSRKSRWSTRYFVAVMACIGFGCSYGMRVNMSVAIIAMANSSYSTDYNLNSSTELCPELGDYYGNETSGESKVDL